MEYCMHGSGVIGQVWMFKDMNCFSSDFVEADQSCVCIPNLLNFFVLAASTADLGEALSCRKKRASNLTT
jgi:hypothetical protein